MCPRMEAVILILALFIGCVVELEPHIKNMYEDYDKRRRKLLFPTKIYCQPVCGLHHTNDCLLNHGPKPMLSMWIYSLVTSL